MPDVYLRQGAANPSDVKLYIDGVTQNGIVPFILSASTYIAASGENTTALLTAPAGKTTGDFVAGRIQDDENPADPVDITIDDYTELEWCVKATDAVTVSEVYEFRVTVNGVVLNTYTVTPLWTIGTPGGGFVPAWAMPGTVTIQPGVSHA